MASLTLDPQTTALVLIDLQQGIVARETQPYRSADVVRNAARLAQAFRENGAPVVLVHVTFRDERDRLTPQVDSPMPAGTPQPNWADLVPELDRQESDIVIVKRQWGAFYGTELDLQLRRRGVKTIVLGGIATNFGVESTARDAFERTYEQIFVEDATTSMNAEAHRFVFENIFPRMGRVRSTAEVLEGIGRG